MKQNLMQEIRENIEAVLAQSTPLGQSLWESLIVQHPADIEGLLVELDKENLKQLFEKLPEKLRLAVFVEFSDANKAFLLSFMDDKGIIQSLNALSPDELTDLFDEISDEELKKYMSLLNKQVREQVISLLQFESDSAGGIMTTDVFTLIEDFTVEQSAKLLQRLRPSKEVHQLIFVTDQDHQLRGYINLEDLVLHNPKERVSSFIKQSELVINANEDQEEVARRMVHYGVMVVPVVDERNHFLGVIPSDTLVDVIMEEATEDVQKMSALPGMKFPYFEMPYWRLLFQRGYVLIALLIAESFTGNILRAYDAVLTSGILYSFISVIISAGGNTGSQTSAVVIQGMASGEIGSSNFWRFLRREFMVASLVAAILGFVIFMRVHYFVANASTHESVAVALSLFVVVLISAMLGNVIPIILHRLNIDPAFSAGPFLATFMDILGIVIFCYISMLILPVQG